MPAEAASPRVRFSVVSAVCNVARYLDEFFGSIVSQPLFEGAVEIIAVEDSSTDESGDILEAWQSRHPDRIRVVRRESTGVSSARNVGLTRARGDWVTFADPDDYVGPGYFAAIDEAIERHSGDDVALLASNIVYYFESDRTRRDTHPLRFRFAEGERAVRIADLGKAIHNNVMSSFFRRSLIEEMDLRFDPLVKPGFEDGHFLGRYLSRFRQKSIVFVPEALYFYRRRADNTSLSGSFAAHPGRYTTQLRYGQIGLLKEVAASGPVPPFIQNMILYSIRYICGRIVSEPETVAFLTADQRRECIGLMREIVGCLDPALIADFDLVDGSVPFRVGLLNAFKNADAPFTIVQVAGFDRAEGILTIVAWTRAPGPALTIAVNGVSFQQIAHTELRSFFDVPFVWEHSLRVAVPSVGRLRAFVGGREADIVIGGRTAFDGLPLEGLRRGRSPGGRR